MGLLGCFLGPQGRPVGPSTKPLFLYGFGALGGLSESKESKQIKRCLFAVPRGGPWDHQKTVVFIRFWSFWGSLVSQKSRLNRTMPFRCSEGGPWGPFGSPSGPFWTTVWLMLVPFGSLFDPLGSPFGPFGPLLVPFGPLFDSFWTHLDPFLTLWDLLLNPLAPFWIPFWLFLGSLLRKIHTRPFKNIASRLMR